LRTHTEEAIIFKPEQNITEERAWYHRCLCPQRRKKAVQTRSFQISRQKDMRAVAQQPLGRRRFLRFPWRGYDLIWYRLHSGNRELSFPGKSQNRPCHVAPFAKSAGANFALYKKTASPYSMYEMRITSRLWSSYFPFNDRINYYATADIYICHDQVPVYGFHTGKYRHKNVLLVLWRSIVLI